MQFQAMFLFILPSVHMVMVRVRTLCMSSHGRLAMPGHEPLPDVADFPQVGHLHITTHQWILLQDRGSGALKHMRGLYDPVELRHTVICLSAHCPGVYGTKCIVDVVRVVLMSVTPCSTYKLMKPSVSMLWLTEALSSCTVIVGGMAPWSP